MTSRGEGKGVLPIVLWLVQDPSASAMGHRSGGGDERDGVYAPRPPNEAAHMIPASVPVPVVYIVVLCPWELGSVLFCLFWVSCAALLQAKWWEACHHVEGRRGKHFEKIFFYLL